MRETHRAFPRTSSSSFEPLRWLAPLLALLAAFALSACQTDTDSADGGDGSGNSGTGGNTATGGQGTGGGVVGGNGTGGELPPACDAYIPRPTPPEVLIGPTGLRTALVNLMNGAQSEILLTMYELDCAQCTGGLIDAHNRGVNVRVLLDFNQDWDNADAIDELNAAGVPLQPSPYEFNHAHAKVMIIDGQAAVIMSANMNPYSMSSERNYGVIDRDPQDVADLIKIFERDWADDGTAIDVSCTRLLVAPENARERLIEHINRAQTNLDLAVMYMSDNEVMSAVKQKAAAGVQVRVLLAHPEWIDDNVATAAEVEAAGATARFFYEWELHAKLVMADGIPLVGSINMSYNSLENNREVAVMVTEEAPRAQIAQQFEEDWSDGVNN